jgi:hypothetical protein
MAWIPHYVVRPVWIHRRRFGRVLHGWIFIQKTVYERTAQLREAPSTNVERPTGH